MGKSINAIPSMHPHSVRSLGNFPYPPLMAVCPLNVVPLKSHNPWDNGCRIGSRKPSEDSIFFISGVSQQPIDTSPQAPPLISKLNLSVSA
jgi:hypothetical protein